MEQSTEDFLASADAAYRIDSPAVSAASDSTIATPDTLPPSLPVVASSEVGSLSFTSSNVCEERSESVLAAPPAAGIASRRCKQRSGPPEPVSGSEQSTSMAASAALARTEFGRDTASSQPEEPPTKAVLHERSELMFLRGKGKVLASGGAALMTGATQRLVLDASEVITTFDVHRPEVQAACGFKLDAREALAYLVCDVLLGTRIPYEHARTIGDRLGKLVFGPAASLPKESYALTRAHDKRVGRLSKLNPDYELKLLALIGEDDRIRSAFERKSVKIVLPSVEDCEAATAPAPPQPPPPPPPCKFEAWCKRRGWSAEDASYFKRRKGEQAGRLREYEREWNPRSWQGRLQLSKLRERDRQHNDLCTCDEGVPSWLCRVARCYSFEVVGDSGCSQRCLPGVHNCDCMLEAWGKHDEDDCIDPAPLLPRPRGWSACLVSESSVEHPYFAPPYWDPAPTPADGWPLVEPASSFANWRKAYFSGSSLCRYSWEK